MNFLRFNVFLPTTEVPFCVLVYLPLLLLLISYSAMKIVIVIFRIVVIAQNANFIIIELLEILGYGKLVVWLRNVRITSANITWVLRESKTSTQH